MLNVLILTPSKWGIRPARIDFQYRLRQFFDHHPKDSPAPGWMTDGVPQFKKDELLRKFAPKVFVVPDTTFSKTGGGA